MASASNDLSHRTEAQASTLEATSASLAEISKAVRNSADAASHARNVVAAADEAARTNSAVVNEATSAMDAISKSHADISQIIGVIDEIAFQTNLLALNAGVEAARAGEAGKGFAVVASEVRALALRSAEAAKEIKTLIGSSGAQVATGVKLVGETGAALAQIVAEVSRINEIVNEIARGRQPADDDARHGFGSRGQDGRGDAAERRNGRSNRTRRPSRCRAKRSASPSSSGSFRSAAAAPRLRPRRLPAPASPRRRHGPYPRRKARGGSPPRAARAVTGRSFRGFKSNARRPSGNVPQEAESGRSVSGRCRMGSRRCGSSKFDFLPDVKGG